MWQKLKTGTDAIRMERAEAKSEYKQTVQVEVMMQSAWNVLRQSL